MTETNTQEEATTLPEGWVETTIGEVGKVVAGGTPSSKREEYFNGPIPWLTPADLSNYDSKYISRGRRNITTLGLQKSSAKLMPTGSVLFSSRAPIGYVVIAQNEISTNQGFKNLVPADGIDSSYIYYFLKSAKGLAESMASGTTFKELSGKKFAQIPLPLPPLPEQRRIVAKLDALMARHRRSQAILDQIPEKIKQFRQAVLARAVSGELTKDWRERNPGGESAEELVGQLISSRVEDYDVEKKREENLNKRVPKLPQFSYSPHEIRSWLRPTVESVSIFIVDCLHSTPKFQAEGMYCIDTTCIKPSKIVWDRARRVSRESFYDRIRRLEPKSGDVLFSREGTIGTTVHYKGEHPICLGQRMMMFRLSSTISPEFFEISLSALQFQNQYKPKIAGTSSPHLNIKDIRKFDIPLPPLPEQYEIVRRVQALFRLADRMEARYTELRQRFDQLPQAILAKAFRGELVPQDPEDEPAGELLERIREAKNQ